MSRSEAIAAILADTSAERHNVTANRPCRHCLNAREQAERLLEHPHLLAALTEAGVLRREYVGRYNPHPARERYVTEWVTA